MPVSLPDERVYYYELRECGNVLLCWIPRRELQAGVRRGKLDASILQDHPGGLDVEVTPSDTGYLAQRYGLDLGLDPADLLLAFEAINASKEVQTAGEVRGVIVEELARNRGAQEPPRWDPRRPISRDQAAVVLKKNPAVQTRIDQGLRSLLRKAPATRSRTRKADVLQNIRRTRGESPAVVFTRLQRQSTKGGT